MTKIVTTRKIPCTCHECGRKSVAPTTTDRTLDVRYDGAVHSIRVTQLPVLQCAECGETTFGNDTQVAIHRALRDHVKLLQPEVIRSNRDRLGLTQQQLAVEVGCAAESLSRWENGAVIQSRAYDNLLRAFFQFRQVREFFACLREVTIGPEKFHGTMATLAQIPRHVAASTDWCVALDEQNQVYERVLSALDATVELPEQWPPIKPHPVTVKVPEHATTPQFALAA